MKRSDWPAGRRNAGFTYLWVLFLVALMGIGLTVAAEITATAAQRDKEKALLAIGRQFRTAISSYYEAQAPGGGVRQYPASLEDLLHDRRFPGVRRHLRKLFVDPLTGKAEWGELRIAGRIVGLYSLSERVPMKQGGFEADDTGFHGKQKYSDWVFSYPSDLMGQTGAENASGQAASPGRPNFNVQIDKKVW